MSRGAALALILALFAPMASVAESLRVATYGVELSRRGPGLLLADILKREDQVMAVAEVIAHIAPDVLLLTGFDHDLEGHALTAFAALLDEAGTPYPHRFAAPPNAGVATGLDLDGNGRTGEARDSQGYGRFTGAGGMAVLSRYPLGAVRDFSAFLWAELPGRIAPEVDGAPFPSVEARAVQRLSSVAHWDVPVQAPGGTLYLLAFDATTPVFDGPEDLNGRRNHDEIAFWARLLDGDLPFAPPAGPVIILGDANLDPERGDGRREAIRSLLDDPRLQDPIPGQPTVDWTDPVPGDMRVDYILPDARLSVRGAGVFWPKDGAMAETVARASRHRLVWVDLVQP